MTKSQIKAELRRSACDDEWPVFDVSYDALDKAVEYKDSREDQLISCLDLDEQRTFFLLVAEAL